MPIHVCCPSCGTGAVLPDHAAGMTAKCKRCNTFFPVTVPKAMKNGEENREESEIELLEPDKQLRVSRTQVAEQRNYDSNNPKAKSSIEDGSKERIDADSQRRNLFTLPMWGAGFALGVAALFLPSAWPVGLALMIIALAARRYTVSDSNMNIEEEFKERLETDSQTKMGFVAARIGLVLLAIAPLCNWLMIGNGGVRGIEGDGRIMLWTTGGAIALGLMAYNSPSSISVRGIFVVIQGWGTIAALWMIGIVFRADELFNKRELIDNPFALALSSRIGIGNGVYMGMVGGLAVAIGLGTVFARQKKVMGTGFGLYLVVQIVAIAIGAVIINGLTGGRIGQFPRD